MAISTNASRYCFTPVRPNLRLAHPNSTAATVSTIEMLPAAPPAYDFAVSSAPFVITAVNVPATIEVNAAITMMQNSQQNSRNKRRPVLPMYFSMSCPRDFPLFLIEAYSAPKSCTAPKKMPPTRTHSTTGSQPNIIATMVPVTGPAPQIDENWCANTEKHEEGEKSFPFSMRTAGVRAFLSIPHLFATQRPYATYPASRTTAHTRTTTTLFIC